MKSLTTFLFAQSTPTDTVGRWITPCAIRCARISL
jgi:hypothetical protein